MVRIIDNCNPFILVCHFIEKNGLMSIKPHDQGGECWVDHVSNDVSNKHSNNCD